MPMGIGGCKLNHFGDDLWLASRLGPCLFCTSSLQLPLPRMPCQAFRRSQPKKPRDTSLSTLPTAMSWWRFPSATSLERFPFALDLIGNFHAVLNASSSWGVSGWTPIAVQSGVYGAYAQSFVTLSQHVLCNGQLENLYSASVIDSLGTSHPTGLRWDDFGCFGSFPQTATTSDGSGFTVTYTSKTAW